MSSIPRDHKIDSSLSLLSEGYQFIPNRSRRLHSDVFETRLMLRKAICATGEDAARMFYHPQRFTRKAAMPPTTLRLLQDIGSVQLLSGESHRHRKQMFMSLMSPGSIQQLAEITDEQWRARFARLSRRDPVVLHREAQGVLCRAVCQWAGVPLAEDEAEQRTAEFAAMIDGAGAIGPRNWKGLLLRSRTERWVRGLIARVRNQQLEVPAGSAAHATAWHRELDGELLSEAVAAVELINVLRPTVAVARYITFAALALHQWPQCREQIRASEGDYLEWFVQEVRRYYPFFPFVAGHVQDAFEWRGHPFTQGDWVLLDLYGTNHDSRIWNDPENFRPERFAGWSENAFNFVPQGGGEHLHGHRCPGEWITIELIKRAVRLLVTEFDYEVPEQDLSIDLARMPAIPESGFVIRTVPASSPKSQA